MPSLLEFWNYQSASKLRHFYIKRFLRIVPALSFSLTIFGILILLLGNAVDLFNVAEQELSSIFFAGNIGAFFTNGNYFLRDPNPFLHTWSLGVEEQVYLFVPILLILVSRVKRFSFNQFWYFVTLVSISNFAVLNILFHTGKIIFGVESLNQVAFYSAGTRVWEFGFGVLTHRLIKSENRKLMQILLLIFTIFSNFYVKDLFPTFLVIFTLSVFNQKVLNYQSNSLISRTLIFFGDRSYSLYLVHFPISYLLRKAPGIAISNEALLIFTYFFLTIFFGEIQYNIVEKKFRANTYRLRILAIYIIAIPIAVASIQILEASTKFLTSTVAPKPALSSTNWKPDCHALVSNFPCVVTTKHQNILLVGDSHAAMLAREVDKIAIKNGYGFSFWTRSGCGFALKKGAPQNDCAAHNLQVFRYIQHSRPTILIISNVDSSHKPPQFQNSSDWLQGEFFTTAQVQRSVSRVVLIGPTPSYEPSSILIQGKLRKEPFSDEKYLISRFQGSKIFYFSSLSNLCVSNNCIFKSNNQFLYEDYDHLTFFGAEKALANLSRYVIFERASSSAGTHS